ncbi:MAG: hypothetical protein H7338_15625 [Candidatus Sericytochromatia bacterium]|nr:hypothetical protein [Candidatus Sericytochromatia bacterium]
MATLKSQVQDILDRKGTIAIKRLSLKVGADLNQLLTGSLMINPTLESKVQTAIRELGF